MRIPTTKGFLNILVDTGANKSYIDPQHVKSAKKVERPALVTNKNGKFLIKHVVNANLLSESFSDSLPYYVFKFHTFFDGLIGYENLSKMNAIIDTKKHQLKVGTKIYQFSKYFPTSLNSHETKENLVKVCTTANGTFLIKNELNLTCGVVLQPGLYEAQNNEALVHVAFNKPNMEYSLIPFQNDYFIMENNNHVAQSKLKLNFPSEHLNDEEIKLLAKTLKPYKSVFFHESEKLSFTHDVKHNIHTTDEKPIHQKTYKYPYHLREEVSAQIDKLLDAGIIRESSSQWTSPIWVVPKKSDNSGKKKYRIVVDYRKLNEKTPADRYPIPEISEILDRLGKAQYFSVLDLASGFHQIEVDPKDVPKTAFNVDHGKYEFVRMPFGLKNAPATFQRLMDSVLRKHIGVRCFVYMDDIIIFSTSLQSHLQDIAKVLQTLKEANLKIQCDKSEFLRKEVEFLGHLVTREGVRPNPRKVEAVKNWPLPRTPKELKSFLGTVGYYRRFIQHFAHIAKPLTSKLRGNAKSFEITPDFEQAFNKLKDIMTTDLLLSHPDFTKPFILTTDASNVAIGAVLAQSVDGKERPIAFLSRTLSKAEENYSATAKELLGIYFATKTFRSYLYGKEFTIYTDHEPLTKELKLTDATGRVTRQRLYLEQFDFKMVYKKGKQNVVADGLSRIQNPELNLQELKNECFENNISYGPHIINKYKNQLIIKISDDNRKSPHLRCTIFPGQTRHVFYRKEYTDADLLQVLKAYLDPGAVNGIFAPIEVVNSCKKLIEQNLKKVKVEFSNIKLPDLVSFQDQQEFIKKCHNFNHRGYKLTYGEIQKSVYFPGMLGKVKAFISNCEDCKFSKYERKPFKIPISRRIYEKPFENVYIDVYVKDTEKFLTLVDSFSKFAQIYKIIHETADELIETLAEYFKTFGLPKMITCDQAKSFHNAKFKNFMKNHNISLHFASCSNSNGIVERFHNTLLEMYLANRRKVEHLTLYEGLALITAIYNESKHSTTNLTPRQIIFGNSTSLNLDEINLAKQQTIQTARDHIKISADNHNAKLPTMDYDNFKKLTRPTILVKGKAKPSPGGHRYRLIEIKTQTDKTVTDEKDIKTHKKHTKT